jgi:ABC-type transporter Mla subunit MlaD
VTALTRKLARVSGSLEAARETLDRLLAHPAELAERSDTAAADLGSVRASLADALTTLREVLATPPAEGITEGTRAAEVEIEPGGIG